MASVRVVAFVLSVTLCVHAYADSPKLDIATLNEAKVLVQKMGGKDQMSRIFDAMRGNLIGLMAKTGKVTVEQATTACDQLLMPALKAHAGELEEAQAAIYAQHYSVNEMQELEQFYATPIGQKVLLLQPVISAEAFSVGRAWGIRIARNAIESNKLELQKRGITL